MVSNRGAFRDRRDAGRQLAERLSRLEIQRPVVLALPRGGVPIGAEIAAVLEAPLDLILVRKLGVPRQPELAVGAVVNGMHREIVLNQDVIAFEGLSKTEISDMCEQALQEISRRRKDYLGDNPYVRLEGCTAIVVDDGIATGATVRAALKGARHRKPNRLILAVPVASPAVIAELRPEVDEVLSLLTPDALFAVGHYYRDFAQVSDAEVRETLARHRSSRVGEPDAPDNKGPMP